MLGEGSYPEQTLNQSFINNAPLLGAGCHAPELPANAEAARQSQPGRNSLRSAGRANAVANSHILESGEEAEQERMDSSKESPAEEQDDSESSQSENEEDKSSEDEGQSAQQEAEDERSGAEPQSPSSGFLETLAQQT